MTTTKRRASMAAMLMMEAVFSTACTAGDILNIVNLLKLLGLI